MYYVHLYEHPFDIDKGGRKLELHVTADGRGGIPLDEIDKYISAGIITPITAVRWRLPLGYCVELYSGRFWKNDICVLEGTGKEEAIDLRKRSFDDRTKSAIIRRSTKKAWCVTVVRQHGDRPVENLAYHTLYSSGTDAPIREAIRITLEYRSFASPGDIITYQISDGPCHVG